MLPVVNHQPTRKRKRPSLVCTNCRRKKVKCNRESPCSNCVKSKCPNSCIYDDGLDNQPSQSGNVKIDTAPYESSVKNPIDFNYQHKNAKTDNVTISLSELNMLKERLQNIESSLNNNNKTSRNNNQNHNLQYPKASGVLPPPIMSPFSSPKPHTSTFALSDTRERPANIQLPPINFKQPYQDPSTISSTMSNNYQISSYSSTAPPAVDYNQSMIGFNPYLNEEDTINFYEGYTSIRVRGHSQINHGPLAWGSLMQKDYVLKVLWDHIGKQKQENGSLHNFALNQNHEINQENTQIVASETNESENNFKKKALETDGYTDLVPYNLLKEKIKKKLNEEGKSIGITLFEGQISMELQLIDRIHQILPKRKVIWKLIDRFFTTLYPFMPFIDETDFRDSVSKIIGLQSYEDVKIKEIKVEKRLDLAKVGLLLVVLRLAYISLFRNKQSVNEERLNTTDPSVEAQELKYLMTNSISIEIVQCAKCCLHQFDILRKTSIPALELSLYLYLYHLFAPEDGDDGDGSDTHVLKAAIIQMAYSLGLNRDPDNFPELLTNKKRNHLSRKIWNLLMLSDIHNAYSYGTHTIIDDESYDTKLPFHEEGNENLIDKNLDKLITENFFHPAHINFYQSLKGILKLVLNVKGKTKLSHLCALVTDFEIAMQSKFGCLQKCMQPPETAKYVFERYFPVKFYISLKSFSVSLYFHIFLHYEFNDTQLSLFYLKKILKIAATDIMPHYFEILGSSEIVCDMIINPKFIQIIHKLDQILIALNLRVNYTIYNLKLQSGHEKRCVYDSVYLKYYTELCKFSSCLTRCAEVSIAAVSKLSARYYNAWKITKGHTFLLKTITSVDYYKQTFNAGDQKIKLPNYSTEQLKDLVNMCEGALKKLGKSNLVGDEFCEQAKCPYNSSIPSTTDSNTTSGTDTSSDARLKTNDFGLDFVNNQEVDKLWLQMLSMKNDQPQQINPPNYNLQQPSSQNNNFSVGTPLNFEAPFTPNFGLGNANTNFDVDDNYDFFADLPFDQMFNSVNM
ncbi:unnamed protein product [Candida verbasci]|uniref:Zn(2)-C6 fungal-type domain-containing protein n=1 Tax=Candida verbasci TaxID=1227364 RepID=A0A9W4TYV4_9ASCO|nr:unnamed protein product [Candida verbasci]